MPNCAVVGCSSHNKMKGECTKFYSFPKNKDLAMQWTHACYRKDKINIKNATICSKHFESKCFFTPLKYKLLNADMPKKFRNLLDDAVPTLFLPKSSSSSSSFSSNSVTCRKRSQTLERKHDLENQQITIANILAYNTNGDNQPSESRGEAVAESTDPNLLTSNEICELSNELQNMKLKMRSIKEEMEKLKLKTVDLTNENKALVSKIKQYHAALHNHFTPGQIKRMLNPNKKFSSWDSIDIASAISLRSVSPKAYTYLKKNHYPLPAPSTLRSWALNLHLNSGLLTDVSGPMKEKSETLNENEMEL